MHIFYIDKFRVLRMQNICIQTMEKSFQSTLPMGRIRKEVHNVSIIKRRTPIGSDQQMTPFWIARVNQLIFVLPALSCARTYNLWNCSDLFWGQWLRISAADGLLWDIRKNVPDWLPITLLGGGMVNGSCPLQRVRIPCLRSVDFKK